MPQEREIKTRVFLGAEGSIVGSAIICCVVGIHYCSTSLNLCTASFDDRTNPQTQETTKGAKFCRQKKIATRRGFHTISLAACDTPLFFR